MRKGDPNIPEVGRREGKDKARWKSKTVNQERWNVNVNMEYNTVLECERSKISAIKKMEVSRNEERKKEGTNLMNGKNMEVK